MKTATSHARLIVQYAALPETESAGWRFSDIFGWGVRWDGTSAECFMAALPFTWLSSTRMLKTLAPAFRACRVYA